MGEKEQLAQEGNYLKADKLKKRINELKSNLSDQKKKDLTYQHSSEMVNLEENYNKEIVDLNLKWDEIFNKFNEKAKSTDENMNQKHRSEMDSLITQLDEKLPKFVKFSKEYLDLRQCEYNLVKQERYKYLIVDT